MGYTHYWYQAPELDQDTFRTAAGDCRSVCEKLDIPLADADGDSWSNPVFGEDTIALNGRGDDSYEGFVVDQLFEGTRFKDPDEQGRYFDFCKTEYRPYDLAVQCCLIVLAHYFGEQFKVTSDGNAEDWAPAREACQAALGFGEDFKLGE